MTVLAGLLGYAAYRSIPMPPAHDYLGSFQDTDGTLFAQRPEASRYKLLTFGYTSCADVCPTTLLKLHQVLQALGRQGNEVAVVFVSTEPGIDTPERMSAFLGAFDRQVIGLRGSPANLEAVARDLSPETAEALAHGRQRAHSGMIYLLRPDNSQLAIYSPTEAAGDIVKSLSARLPAQPG